VFAAIRQSIFAGEDKMTNFRKYTLGIVLGLSTALAGVAYAQNPTQDKKPESCCAMESCCCKGDSCKPKSGSMNHAAMHKQEGCCGDSCKMEKDDNARSDKHECCGDSCAMKKEGASSAGATASDKHECCCSGDSCKMKDMKDKS
jgi:hypothetical protein